MSKTKELHMTGLDRRVQEAVNAVLVACETEADKEGCLTEAEAKVRAFLAAYDGRTRTFTVTYRIVTTRTFTQEVEAATADEASGAVLNEEFACHDEGEEVNEDTGVEIDQVEEQGR